MNRYFFDFANVEVAHMDDLAQLFILINTIGVNPDFNLKSDAIQSLGVDLPFDNQILSTFSEFVVENSEIQSSPDLKTFPYVTTGNVVGVVSSDESPKSDFSRYYHYKIATTAVPLVHVYVGIANSSLTESYAPFGVKDGQYPPALQGLAITSVNALQSMVNACRCEPRNPSTGLSASDLSATYRP